MSEKEEHEKALKKAIREQSAVRSKEDVPRIFNYGSSSTRFFFCKEKNRGRAVFRYSFGKQGNYLPATVTIDVAHLWCDPTMNVACCIMEPNLKIPEQLRFYNSVKAAAPGFYEDAFSLMARGGVITWAPFEENMLSVDVGLARFRKFPWFASKHEAVSSVVELARRYLLVGGLGGVNFNRLSDATMRLIGFDNIKDEAGIGPDIWWGNVKSSFGGGTGEDKLTAARKILSTINDEICEAVKS